MVLLFTAAMVALIALMFRHYKIKSSPECKERVKSMKEKVFYNALIRFAFLSAMKLNLGAMLNFEEFSNYGFG